MIRGSVEVISLNLYVVREDDPYLDFYRDDYVESDGLDDDDDGARIDFFVGQEFVSKEKCREII